MKKLSLAFAFILFSMASTFAQPSKIEMADALRSSGKIWVVVCVILTIVIGLFIYLFSIDKKVSKLEKK